MADLKTKYDDDPAAAQVGREQDLADARTTYARAQADAQAAHAQALAELQVAKQRELEAAELARQQDLAQAAAARLQDIQDAKDKFAVKARDAAEAANKEIDAENKAWATKHTNDVNNINIALGQYSDYWAARKQMMDSHLADEANQAAQWEANSDALVRSMPNYYGQSGQVTSNLTNSMYSPPATPSRSSVSSSSRNITARVIIEGNVDAVTSSQLTRVVSEIINNALA